MDFYAFILGMFAGLSFLTRMLKYFLEKLNIKNITEEDLDLEHSEKELLDVPENENEKNKSEN